MEHVEGMALINNPIVNSYKRFVPGYNAPVKITSSTTDREALIRMNAKGKNLYGNNEYVDLTSLELLYKIYEDFLSE